VDDQLVPRRLLHGQVARPGPFENLIHVNGGLSDLVGKVHCVGHEAARVDELTPKPLTASWIALTWDGWVGLSDMRTAMSLAFGTTACRNSTPLTIRSASKLVTPVTLPPGRARLSTSPKPTGSAGRTMTIGMVAVARLAARTAGVVSATMTSGFSATSSVARLE